MGARRTQQRRRAPFTNGRVRYAGDVPQRPRISVRGFLVLGAHFQNVFAGDAASFAAHTLRSGQGTNMARGPAHFVHNDFSNQLRSSYMEMIDKGENTLITGPLAEGGLGISAEQLSRGRLVVLNYW